MPTINVWIDPGTGTILNVAWTASSATSTSNWISSSNTTAGAENWFMGGSATTNLYVAQEQQAMQMMLAQQQAAATRYAYYDAYRNTESEEQRAERERRLRADHERAVVVRRERDLARDRARELLLEHLTPEQRKTFVENGWFIVQGGKTKRRYKIITGGVAGNIYELNAQGDTVARLCCHASRDIPEHDHHLAQKIMLEVDERAFCRIANRTLLRDGEAA